MENDIDANRTNGGDGAEIKAELVELAAQGGIITDGHAYWSKRCPVCHQMTMEVVRPGKVQCTEGCGR